MVGSEPLVLDYLVFVQSLKFLLDAEGRFNLFFVYTKVFKTNVFKILKDVKMKVTKMDAHDRLLKFKEQSDYISKGCQDCIDGRPEEFTCPFYIFAHTRSIGEDERVSIFNDDVLMGHIDPMYQRKYRTIEETPSSRLIWAPRLTKPTPQSNSMLFKAYPALDEIKVIWMIPSKELFMQYTKGNMTEHKIVHESIHNFLYEFDRMSARESDDLSDLEVNRIYDLISKNKTKPKFEMI